MTDRRAELATNLAAVRERIDRACAAAGRDSAEITLLAVTKTWPASDVRLLHELGLRDVAENRDQEAAAKAAELADLTDLRWHFVGQLQSNKARSVARYAAAVHSVDRPSLVDGLARAADAAGRPLDVFVQVNLSGEQHRGGAAPDAVPDLADAVAAAEGLTLRGVMAVAPLGADPHPAYARLAEIAAVVRREHPAADAISAGMSGDLEAAIAHGSTVVRVGTALLGGRPPIVG